MENKDLMNCIQLLKRARKLKNNENGVVKIAVIGSYSLQNYVSVLRYLLSQEQIEANIYEGFYNSIQYDVFQDDSGLFKFQPNYIIILTSTLDIKQQPKLFASKEEQKNSVLKVIDYYQGIWERLSQIPGCQILQTNFVVPIIRQLGNLESNYIFSKTIFYQKVNIALVENKRANVTILDMDNLASTVGKESWFDYSAYFLSKSGFCLDYIGQVTELAVKQIKALMGKTKKCLVLDLDNTLWGGVVSEEGCNGIQINQYNPVGESYYFFQQYILELKNRGVILAVCSKNDLNIAKEPFIHNKEMVLRLEDISCFVANWDDKVRNIRMIAKQLNIGIDSLVFFDDNPAERELVRQFLPEVFVVDVPEDSADYAKALSQASPFEWVQITKEDVERPQSYYQNQKRIEMRQNSVDYESYLKTLDMHGEAGRLCEADVSRFTQLVNKSNQFNLRTQRYTQQTIEEFMKDSEKVCLYVKLRDMFGDYGLISCIVLEKRENTCFIDTWVMSCRVLKRGVEELAFQNIVAAAKGMGCTKIIGEYIPTKKNDMVKGLYNQLGFETIEKPDWYHNQEGGKFYQFDCSNKVKKAVYIKTKE